MAVDRPVHPSVDYTALAEEPNFVAATKAHRTVVVVVVVVKEEDPAGFVAAAVVAEDPMDRHRFAADRSCLDNDDVGIVAVVAAAAVEVVDGTGATS